MHDIIHMRRTDTKLLAELSLANAFVLMQPSDHSYRLIGKFGAAVSFTGWMPRTALFNCVAGIVQRRPKKQMLRIAARWIVAPVTNKHPIRDWAILHFHHKTMGHCMAATDPESAISVRKFCSYPMPTCGFVRRDVYLLEEGAQTLLPQARVIWYHAGSHLVALIQQWMIRAEAALARVLGPPKVSKEQWGNKHYAHYH